MIAVFISFAADALLDRLAVLVPLVVETKYELGASLSAQIESVRRQATYFNVELDLSDLIRGQVQD
jgi:hypothetical protein